MEGKWRWAWQKKWGGEGASITSRRGTILAVDDKVGVRGWLVSRLALLKDEVPVRGRGRQASR